jgi:hypothetical protein
MTRSIAPNRAFTVYHEVGSRYEVPYDRAHDIYVRSTAVLSQFAGTIAISRVYGLKIPTGDNPLDVSALTLPEAFHNVVMTQRSLPSYDDDHAGYGGGAYMTMIEGVVVASQTMISVGPPEIMNDTIAVGHGVHQLTHTFGLTHCTEGMCVMQSCTEANDDLLETVEQRRTPYCFDHEFELGVTARMTAFGDF